MKTISGSVVSSAPASLSKAASIMNSFITVENGASSALTVYLQRTNDAFNELVQLHSDLEGKRSNRKRIKAETLENGTLITLDENHRENKLAEGGVDGNQSEERKIEKKKKKKKKDEMKSEGSENEVKVVERESGRVEVDEKRKKKIKEEVEVVERESARVEVGEKRKKRMKEEVENGGFDDSEERHRKKKKRKHETEN